MNRWRYTMNTKTWHPKKNERHRHRHPRRHFWRRNVHDELGSAISGGKSQPWESPKTCGLLTLSRMSLLDVGGFCEGVRVTEKTHIYIYINSQVGLEGLQVFVEQVFSLKISLEYWVHVETERKSWLMRRLAERGWLNHIFFLICKASLIPSYNLYQQEKTLIHIDPIGSNLSPALGNTWHANFQSFSLRSDIHFPQSWFSRKWV